MKIRWSDEPVGESYDAKKRQAMQRQFEQGGASSIKGQILNTRPDAIDHRDLFYEPRLTEVPAFNYAELVRQPDFAVRLQGIEGSCTGQALAAVIDLQNIKRFRQGAAVPQRVSARMAYESAKLYDQYPDDGLEGSSIRGAIKGFYHRGICDFRLARYHEHDTSFEYNKFIKDNANSVVLGAYFRLRHMLNHYHTAISEAGAILCSAMIHSGWERKQVRANGGRIVLPKSRGNTQAAANRVKLLGAHAFAIVGYDDEGFLVLNSWGSSWGGFNPVAEHVKALRTQGKSVLVNGQGERRSASTKGDFHVNGTNKRLRGIAHWSYDDWALHVLDAWVLRLAAPTRKEAWYSGGFSSEAELAVESQTPRSRNVSGHFIHIKDGEYVGEPPYDNCKKTIQNTAKIIAESRKQKKSKDRYKHLVFYAHGALNTIDHSSARAAAMTPVFKRHGIYPMFYFWRTGIGSIASEILKSQLPEVEPRSQGKQSIINHLLERKIETVGRAIWRDIKNNAHDCFFCNQGSENFEFCEFCQNAGQCNGGKGWEATRLLIEAACGDLEGVEKEKQRPIKIHLVAHSAGALMLGPLVQQLKSKYKDDWSDYVGSITLMAPACTTAYFLENFGDVALTVGKRFKVLNLPPATDASMDPNIHPYGKSLLHLISNAFENQRGTPIAGLDIFWPDTGTSPEDGEPDEIRRLREIKQVIDYRVVNEEVTDDAVLHMGYDNNADIMNSVLQHILGRRAKVKGGFDSELLRNGKF